MEAALETSLSRLVGFINPTQKAIPIRQWPLEADLLALRDNNQIQLLANQLAVDRSDKHLLGYTSVYQVILRCNQDRARSRPPKVVEIGIGSNNPRVASNIGVFGTPGASLRALRNFFPSVLLGGDVNCTIIFEEPGITTHSVGQIDTSTLQSFSAAAGSFDLFVKDELHELDANLNALYVALELVVGGAWVVIEDINPALKQTWLAVAKYLRLITAAG